MTAARDNARKFGCGGMDVVVRMPSNNVDASEFVFNASFVFIGFGMSSEYARPRRPSLIGEDISVWRDFCNSNGASPVEALRRLRPVSVDGKLVLLLDVKCCSCSFWKCISAANLSSATAASCSATYRPDTLTASFLSEPARLVVYASNRPCNVREFAAAELVPSVLIVDDDQTGQSDNKVVISANAASCKYFILYADTRRLKLQKIRHTL